MPSCLENSQKLQFARLFVPPVPSLGPGFAFYPNHHLLLPPSWPELQQQNLKTRAADHATEELGDRVRNPRSEFENEYIKSKPILKHLYRPLRQKLNPGRAWWMRPWPKPQPIIEDSLSQPSRAGPQRTCEHLIAQQSNLVGSFRVVLH